jgi:hypothetical protein
MSSTNRGGIRSEADNYSTPLWAVKRLLDVYRPPPGPGVWLEPAAGDGNIIRAVNEVVPSVKWLACELREECRPALAQAVGDPRRVIITDYITAPPQIPEGKRIEVVITNPPYRLAHEFIAQSFGLAEEVVMLLRLNYLGSDHRAEFLRHYPPDVFVLPNRPSFKGNGKTDSPEYAWFVFRPFEKRDYGTLQILPSTPSTERGLLPRGGRRKTPTVGPETA